MSLPLPASMFQSVTLLRYAAGSYVSGRWVEGAESEVTITASVQPATSSDYVSLEEGDRRKGAITVWSPDEIRAGDDVAGKQPDRISFDGAYWSVWRVDYFPKTPQLTHYRAVAIREQKQ